MYTIEDRNRVRDRVLALARSDDRIVAAALIGSTTSKGGGGDRWSDLDLTFGVADEARIDDVLADWTTQLEREYGAIHLFDLPHMGTLYRVLLLKNNLQVDLSFTPARIFGPLGPKFELLYGRTVEREKAAPFSPRETFGWATEHLLRARFSIERGRLWQAEYMISEARERILALACFHRGLRTSYARDFDELPADLLERFKRTLVGSLDRRNLLEALDGLIEELLRNSQDVPDLSSRLEPRLREVTSAGFAKSDSQIR